MAHRRHRSRRRLQHFLPLLVMASTSSALSLSNFQVITSNQIPRDCISAYQSDIDGCKRKDFMNGRQCSSDCVQGLEETANLVKEACGDLNPSRDNQNFQDDTNNFISHISYNLHQHTDNVNRIHNGSGNDIDVSYERGHEHFVVGRYFVNTIYGAKYGSNHCTNHGAVCGDESTITNNNVGRFARCWANTFHRWQSV
ncbi:hypothetical protein GGR54DRAFT_637203 [Hypoxylon sp. NC1633]|nr:hypothetical protein GGR54DRAFT_637203 [Hypoxylon sp. NC1633]